MANYGIIQPRLSNSLALVRAGLLAAHLYSLGTAHTDPYGRLEAAPGWLAENVLAAMFLSGATTEGEVCKARDALVREGLWHLYRVNGREYVEYEGYDGDQTGQYLPRRAAKPKHPDPPDRPDLWARNRTHRPLAKGEAEPTEPAQPSGSADLPAAPTKPTGVPTSGAAVSSKGEGGGFDGLLAFIDEGIGPLQRAHEQHTGRPLSRSDYDRLRRVLTDAYRAGVEWQTLRAIMLEKQQAFQPTNTSPHIKSCEYYMNAWDAHIREAGQDGGQTIHRRPPEPPPDDDDPIAARVRAQSQQLVSGYGA